MSKEIKFRVWDSGQKRFRLDCFLSVGGELWFNDGGRIGSLPQSEVILQQFTGLRDKNGVEIYEGDILDWFEDGEVEAQRFEMRWGSQNAGFYFHSHEDPDYHALGGMLSHSALTIIGNIYEHLELIDAEKGE